MPMNTQGRPTRMADNIATGGYAETTSGSKGLEQAEPLIYERGSAEQTGVDLPEPKGTPSRLGGLERKSELGLPGLSEPETMRHYVRLSRKNYAIDL